MQRFEGLAENGYMGLPSLCNCTAVKEKRGRITQDCMNGYSLSRREKTGSERI